MASHVVTWNEAFPRSCHGGAVAVGKFDGVHLGHGALVGEAAALARRLGGPAVIVTFDPHPLALLRPEQPLSLLTTPQDRADLLHRLGADHVLTLRTTHELLNLPATAFFEQVLRGRLGARGLVEGPNFRFGRGREGDVELLRRLCAESGATLAIVPPVVIGGAETSSGRVRAALLSGDVRAAARLLGRPYLLRGVVGTGRRVGGTIGFPTANLERVSTVIPADGVYAAFVRLPDGAVWPAAVNVGGNPTFGEHARKIEAHLLDFSGDLYGQDLAIEFIERLRETRPFNGVEELTEQLHRDVGRARAVLEEERRQRTDPP
jgi:riboflavin kinase / FMN adenylyltransferase